jgi:aerobic carbon-monoxide dehydrogenase medium subunit
MKPPPFAYAAPETLQEAVALLAEHGGQARPISGGQSLMPVLNFRLASPTLLVDLRRIPGLDTITLDTDWVRLGARVRWCDIERDARLATAHPLLQKAIEHVAHYQIRSRGTVGGSVAHADPASEMPCITTVTDAVLHIIGPTGTREIPAKDFFLGPLTTALTQDELITAIRLPAWKPGRRWAFQEFARRRGDFALAGTALFWDPAPDGTARDVHIAAFGACSRPMRLPQAEAALEGHHPTAATIAEVARLGATEIDPSEDIHASPEYRRFLLETLLTRALTRAAA